ncbi:hypothetical protein E2562_014946, partial [Oryza meyeriana var. granulata]
MMICLWCWHQIMEMDQKEECGGRCPACRSLYNKDRIMGTSISNQILKELCADKSNLQKEQTKCQKQKPVKVQSRVAEESLDPYSVRVIQRKLVYIVGMPSEFASDKVLRQKNFLGQYGKIENIIIDNVGANQHIPDSGRVATFGVTRYCHIWLSNKVCRKPICSYVHQKAPPEDICTKDDVAVFCARLQHLLGMDTKGLEQRSGNTLPPPGDSISRTTICNGNSKDKTCSNDSGILPNYGNKNPGTLPATTPRDSNIPTLQENHDSAPNNQQGLSASVSQELPPLGPKVHHLNDKLASNGDKPQASVQSANDTLNSKQALAAPARDRGEGDGENGLGAAVGVEAAAAAEGDGEGAESDCSMMDLTAAEEKDASRMTRLTDGSSRMDNTSCSSSTLTARGATSGHPRRCCACARLSAATSTFDTGPCAAAALAHA